MADWKLAYAYHRNSSLERRTFVVDTTVNYWRTVQFEVTTPDYLAAESVVRKALNGWADCFRFTITMVREVVTVRSIETRYSEDRRSHWYVTVDRVAIKVPDEYRGRL